MEHVHLTVHPDDTPLSQRVKNKDALRAKIVTEICNFIAKESAGVDIDHVPIRIQSILETQTGRDIYTLVENYSAKHPFNHPEIHDHLLEIILRMNNEAGGASSHVNISGKIRKFNAEFSKQFGYEDDELVDRNIESLLDLSAP
ncbi:MAG: hypothetical protein ACOYN2_04645 [Patescibacteria group bacterium]